MCQEKCSVPENQPQGQHWLSCELRCKTFALSHFRTFALSHFRAFALSHFRTFALSRFRAFALSHFRTFALSHFRTFAASRGQRSERLLRSNYHFRSAKAAEQARAFAFSRCLHVCIIFAFSHFSRAFLEREEGGGLSAVKRAFLLWGRFAFLHFCISPGLPEERETGRGN